MNDEIEHTPFERQLAATLRRERHQISSACLDAEEMLDLVEQGDKHPRYTALKSHIDDCQLCSDEYALIKQTWRAARGLPAEAPVALGQVRPAAPEAPDIPVAPTPSHPSFVQWLRGRAWGGAPRRIAWGLASSMLLVAGSVVWQRQHTLRELQIMRIQLKNVRTQMAAAQYDNQQLNRRIGYIEAADAALRATDRKAQHDVEAARQAASRKAVAAAAMARSLQRQVLLARDDTVTSHLLMASIAGLRIARGTVRSDTDVRLRSPLATCVLDERPRFRWALDNPTLSITGYEVVVDGNNKYHRVKRLPKDADEWDMSREPASSFPPLKRDAIYRWQVHALVAGDAPIISSTAIFKIASQAIVSRIDQARRRDAGRPLPLFRTYLQNGLLDDARREVNDMLDSLQRPPQTTEH
jgi:hypothetical protein